MYILLNAVLNVGRVKESLSCFVVQKRQKIHRNPIWMADTKRINGPNCYHLSRNLFINEAFHLHAFHITVQHIINLKEIFMERWE